MEMKITESIQKLTWNFDDIKKELEKHVEQYANLVVNENNLQDMEKTQREIASIRTKLTKFRTAVKKDLEKPLTVFNGQVKELLSLVESVEVPIKEQLEKYEMNRRFAKSQQIQGFITTTSAEMKLDEKYRSQIEIADKWLNRTQKWNETKEDIYTKINWFLDIQEKEIAAENFRKQKIEMAKFLCESLSTGLATPITFREIENKIDDLDISEIKLHIETEIAKRKEREEKAIKQAIEREEQKKIEAEKLAEKKRITEEKQAESEKEEAEKLAKIETKKAEISSEIVPQVNDEPELYNAQFVVYGVTTDEIETIKLFLEDRNINFKHEIKKV